MFNKKKAEAAAGTTPSALPPGMMQAAEFTTETKAITAGPVPAAQFDIPPGWKLVVPSAKAQKEFTCPKS
jgi:hypothetical protein